MRFLIITALCLFGHVLTAHATPITKDAATAFYENCKSQPTPQGLTAKGQRYMCACNAAKMVNTMTVEDVKAMAQQDQTGRNATNKMIINVYAPCMGYPAKDHYYNNCITNPQTQSLTKNPQALCECMSSQVANYLEQNGSQVFREILSQNPNLTDPMTALTNDSKFQKYAQSRLIGCVTK